MISVSIKIGEDGQIRDTLTTHGLVYLDSDKRVGPESKGFESTSYPEQPGENILPKTVDAPFDYKVKFFIQATDIKNANARIADFNSKLCTEDSQTHIKTFKRVEFYNYYKRHKIVGYPLEISEAEEFWRDSRNQQYDVVVVELTIRVTNPTLCDYNLLPA